MNLSYKETQEVLEEVENPEYSNPKIIHIKKTRLSIFRYNKESGLILIYGDEFVGLEHIITRHSLLSRDREWNDNGSLKEEATKFSADITQANYMKIAKYIYKEENKNEKDNKNSELFDLYEGYYNISAEEKIKCNLLIYKNTGIIHTLYPIYKNKYKKYNKKRTLQLKQSFCNENLNLETDIHTLSWSYKNQDKIEMFKVIIRKVESSDIEYWHIQKNTLEGVPFYTTLTEIEKPSKQLDFGSLSTYMNYHNKENIEWIEKEIKKISIIDLTE